MSSRRTLDARSLLTTREVADWLGVSPKTVLRRARAGEIPSFRIGTNAIRFNSAEVADWLEERRRVQAAP